MKTKEIAVMPGAVIATEEEYVAGKNTYVEEGQIKAKNLGVPRFDHERKEASIEGKSVDALRSGDVVFGKIILLKESMVVVELVSAENGKKITQKSAQLPVRNVSTEFVDNLKKMFKIGDIIKAKVSTISPLGIDLITNETGLGVIKAFCGKCRGEMSHSSGKLMCLSCGNIEERRWHTDEQVPRQRSFGGDRGGFRGGGGRGFGGPRRSFGGDRGGFRGGSGRSFGGREEGSNRGFSRGGRGGERR